MKLTIEIATYNLMNEILNVWNSKLIAGGIFCDLEKAFSCVNHDILLPKLETYGITDENKELYPSHLKGRYQKVLICNKSHHYSTLSNWTLIKHGVLQRSILGPMIFLLYVNGVPHLVSNKSTPVLFADNTSIFFTH